jgi:uncharacterized protein (DUF1330 family)
MAHEVLVGLEVVDDNAYSAYRKEMTPLLERAGGGFRYDFRVSEVLKNENKRLVNRVFLIFFKDKSAMDSFFTRADYLEIKKKYFENAVRSTTIISEYERK